MLKTQSVWFKPRPGRVPLLEAAIVLSMKTQRILFCCRKIPKWNCRHCHALIMRDCSRSIGETLCFLGEIEDLTV